MKLNDLELLILPGWQDSLAGHWQTLFEAELGATRVQQADWMHPKLDDWVANVHEAVGKLKKPGLLIAHSLGCTTAAHWGVRYGAGIAGAFLVAPPDINRADMPSEITSFRPEVATKLPFPSVLVGTSSDPYASLDRLKEISAGWGSRFILSKSQGHINPDAGHGPWPEGMELLKSFIASLET